MKIFIQYRYKVNPFGRWRTVHPGHYQQHDFAGPEDAVAFAQSKFDPDGKTYEFRAVSADELAAYNLLMEMEKE